MAVYVSKMAAAVVGPTVSCVFVSDSILAKAGSMFIIFTYYSSF